MFFVACLVRSFGFRVKTSILLLFAGDTAHTPVDLSKATLKDATFSCGTLSMLWIVAALQIITPKHQDLQQISICAPTRSPSTVPVPTSDGSPEKPVMGSGWTLTACSSGSGSHVRFVQGSCTAARRGRERGKPPIVSGVCCQR